MRWPWHWRNRGAYGWLPLAIAAGIATPVVGSLHTKRAAARRDHAAQPSNRSMVRVSLATGVREVPVAATGAWRLQDRANTVLVRGASSDVWVLERREGRLRARRPDGTVSPWGQSPLTLRVVDAGALVKWGDRRYRGELQFVATDSGVIVVNRVATEDYLRGVVPLELNTEAASDLPALAAQAIAARSYAVAKVAEGAGRAFDLRSGTSDQVYGGVAAERAIADAAIQATSGIVLMYDGRPVSGPYHSTCGGSTATPDELFRATPEPYLKRVSDRIPGTNRYYCDISPRFRWARTFDAAALATIMARYLPSYATNVPPGGIGPVRNVLIESFTPSRRVEWLTILSDRGSYRVRGNDVRFVFRDPNGEPLNSTMYALEPVIGRDGLLTQLTFRGQGNGHGVGMCQWGAIGRARAGQDYRAILAAYYPGTTLGRTGG